MFRKIILNTNSVFCTTKVSNKDFLCCSKLSHSFPLALFKASRSHPSRHVSEELFIHIKALAVRLHTEQAQMKSYSKRGGLHCHKLDEVIFLCFKRIWHIWDVRNGAICYFWDTLWEDSDRQEHLCLGNLHMKMFQQQHHALICCGVIRLPKFVPYSCFISIAHVEKNHSGKLWRFANLAKMGKSHKNMSESQLAPKRDQKFDFE